MPARVGRERRGRGYGRRGKQSEKRKGGKGGGVREACRHTRGTGRKEIHNVLIRFLRFTFPLFKWENLGRHWRYTTG